MYLTSVVGLGKEGSRRFPGLPLLEEIFPFNRGGGRMDKKTKPIHS